MTVSRTQASEVDPCQQGAKPRSRTPIKFAFTEGPASGRSETLVGFSVELCFVVVARGSGGRQHAGAGPSGTELGVTVSGFVRPKGVKRGLSRFLGIFLSWRKNLSFVSCLYQNGIKRLPKQLTPFEWEINQLQVEPWFSIPRFEPKGSADI